MQDSPADVPAHTLREGTPFAIEWADDADSFVVAIHGDLDLASRDRVRAVFERALQGRAPEIVVDLGFCTFLDSCGLVALLSLNRRVLRSVGRDLRILPGPPQVQRVFALTDLLEVLPFDR